jgi:hypothetical protein
VYVSAELVSDVKECKHGLGWDTSYRNCHRGISPFAVPHMSMKHQQECNAYQDRLQQVTTTTLGDNHYPGRHRERREQPQSSAARLPWTSTTTVQLRPPTWRTRWYSKCAHQRGGSHSAQTAGEGRPLHPHRTTRNYISVMGNLPGCSRILGASSRTTRNASRVSAPIYHKLHWSRTHPNRHHGSPS